jgi:hypothetical protein
MNHKLLAAVTVLWLIPAPPSLVAQEKATVRDFAKSPTEHIINRVDEPFVVHFVTGTISCQKGEALPNVLFEIQGPGIDLKIRRGTTDANGRFKIGDLPAGSYKFKATRNGFQSVMGTITVSKKAPKAGEIKITMPIGV